MGDDAHWADPDLDDSQWPIAEDGRVPTRSRDRDGFLWVRMRVPVEKDAQAPPAIYLWGLGAQPMAWQVYVSGLAIGGQGMFPPNAWPVYLPHSPVMNLPQALSLPGSTAVIAIREWYAPSLFTIENSSRPSVNIGSPSLLQLADEAAGLHATLYVIPVLAIQGLLAVVGVFMLILWRRTGDRESLWSGLVLIATFNSIIGFVVAGSPHASWQTSILAIALPHALNMPVSLEFVRALFRIRSRVFRWTGHIGWPLVQVGAVLSNFVPGSPIAVRIGQSAIAKNGNILIPVSPADSWFYRLALLDPNRGQASIVPVTYEGDTIAGNWASDGRILAAGLPLKGQIWRFATVAKAH